MRLTVVGCGDAFGSGGRLQSCYQVETSGARFLIDCGASSLIGFNRLGLDPNSIDTIYISHLHGDHFPGLVWWMMQAHHVSKRTAPIRVIGPQGIEARYQAAAEILFPGSTTVARRFEMRFQEWQPGVPVEIAGVRATPFEVSHPSGAPPYALRFEGDGRTLTFSGDTEWVDALVTAGNRADLMIIECYQFDAEVRYHMTWKRIGAELDRIGAKRVMLTHMSAPMLARRHEIADPRVLLAEDGLVIDI